MELVVRRLLDSGVLPPQKDTFGRTALDYVRESGQNFKPGTLERLAAPQPESNAKPGISEVGVPRTRPPNKQQPFTTVMEGLLLNSPMFCLNIPLSTSHVE